MELTCDGGDRVGDPAQAQELDQIELVPLGDRRVLDDPGHARSYGAQPGRDRGSSGLVRGIGFDPQLREPEFQRLATGRRAARTGAPHGGRTGRCTTPPCGICRCCIEGLAGRGHFARKCTWKGLRNLLGLDLHLTRERLRELLRALEEKKRLIELLDRFLEQPAGELEVHVGLEEAHPAMKDLALIGMTVRMASGLPAKVAVLGPMRMHYERVMAAVLQTSRALESAQF